MSVEAESFFRPHVSHGLVTSSYSPPPPNDERAAGPCCLTVPRRGILAVESLSDLSVLSASVKKKSLDSL